MLGLLLRVVLRRVGGGALCLEEMLDQEVIIIVFILVLGPIYPQQVGAGLGFGRGGVVGLGRTSCVGVALWGGQEGRGENRGQILVAPCSTRGLGRPGRGRRVQPRANDPRA